MGTVIFSGSLVTFSVESIVFIGLIIFYYRKGLFKRKNNRTSNIMVLLGVLITIVFSNFQYTSKPISVVVNEFDNNGNSSSAQTEHKLAPRMTSEDAKNKLNEAIEKKKQENVL